MRVVVGVVGMVTVVGLSACGAGDGGRDGATPAATDYASCLRANGVTLPSGRAGFPSGRPSGSGFPGGPGGTPPTARPDNSGGPGGPGGGGRPGGGFGGTQPPTGVDQATWEKAQKACEGLRGSGGPGGGTNRPDNGALTAYRNCLSEHGVTLNGGLNSLDTTDPKVAEAVAACAPLRPTAGTTPSPTPTG